MIVTGMGLRVACEEMENKQKNAKFWWKCHKLPFFPFKLTLQIVIVSCPCKNLK